MKIPASQCCAPSNGALRAPIFAVRAGQYKAIRAPTLMLIALASFFAALAQFAPPACAHDDASWIQMNPDYVDRIGRHCCGPQDCERIPESYISEEGNEIVILPTGQRFKKGVIGTYPSVNNDWWWCKERAMPWLPRPTAKCVFFPFHGE
jgi:hypothetical protein